MTATSSVFASPNRVTSVRYVRVAWPGMDEAGELANVTGCTVGEDSESTLKVSGTLSYGGATGLTGLDDMVRIYSVSTAGGVSETVCHGTLIASATSRGLTETGESGEAGLYSVLKFMQDRLMGDATVLAAGESPLALAVSLAEGCGLYVVADASDYKAAGDHSWDAGTDALTIANDCLELCGFASATVDAYGNVLMRRYVDPEDRAAVATVSDEPGGSVIGGRKVSGERDLAGVPNVSYVTVSPAEQDAEPVTGKAVNDDPASPFSTVSRGREISTHATYTELDGSADDKALQLLRSAMRVTERYELDMLWYPFSVGDVLTVDYARMGLAGVRASVVSRETAMTPALKARVVLRRTVDTFEVRHG